MMIVAAAVVAAIAFIVALRFSGLVPAATGAADTARGALGVMRDQSLDDDAKETAVQRAAGAMFMAFGSILLRSALTLGAPAAVIGLAHLTGLADAQATMDFLLTWEALIGFTVTAIAAVWLWRRLT